MFINRKKPRHVFCQLQANKYVLLEQLVLVMLILWQHHYSESKIWDLCGLEPHNLSIDCNPVLSTEPTGPHFESLTMLS